MEDSPFSVMNSGCPQRYTIDHARSRIRNICCFDNCQPPENCPGNSHWISLRRYPADYAQGILRILLA
ncbi:MAG: hypothetical protein GX927_13880 [Lentisphaerae bacterium]|nr:hypothetical protein [Lentisphaerota bacterium]